MTEFKNSSATPSYINFNIDEQETQLQDKIAAVKKLFDDFPNIAIKDDLWDGITICRKF